MESTQQSLGDVAFKKKEDGYVFKAMTPNAIELMGPLVGGPWVMAKEIFVSCNSKELNHVEEILTRVGLKLYDVDNPPTKKIDSSKYLA